MSRVVLLGPQHERPTVGTTVAELGVQGAIATITAGWQEWELDDRELSNQLKGRAVNLGLYSRAEAVWKADHELRSAHRALQDRLQQLRKLYGRRLAHLANAWVELIREAGSDELLAPERTHALEAIRSLDAHHLDRVSAEIEDFETGEGLHEREAVVRERAEIARTLEGCGAVVVMGGHVALLYNRLRLFAVTELLDDLPVIACSGGAMVLGERVVLFHDAPPWGPGNTEVALPGLGLHRGLVLLPHARTRLRLDDQARVARLVTRLAPSRCVVLEAGTRLDWDGQAWSPVKVDYLEGDGTVRRWASAA